MTNTQEGKDESSATTPNVKDDGNKKLHSAVEFEPPLACVRRILKHSLPSSTNVGKDASAAFARACGIFIIYVTACANDFAREHKRQTITANDVLAAVQELDFDSFTPDMTAFLESYRQTEKKKKDAKAAAKKGETESGEKTGDDDDEEEDDDDESDMDEEEVEDVEDEEIEEEDVAIPESRKRKENQEETDGESTESPTSPKKRKMSEVDTDDAEEDKTEKTAEAADPTAE